METDRPGWDDYFMGMAVAASARGDCIRSKVGAVLVENETHRIISTGYNGSPPGGPSCLAGECPRCLSDAPSGSAYEGCIERHAEDNCVQYAVEWYDTHTFDHHTMFITRQPCILCLPMLMWEHSIPRIVYREKEAVGLTNYRWVLKEI